MFETSQRETYGTSPSCSSMKHFLRIGGYVKRTNYPKAASCRERGVLCLISSLRTHFHYLKYNSHNSCHSCLALNDLLRGRPLDDIIHKLPEIWETLFRVQDDIKVLFLNCLVEGK